MFKIKNEANKEIEYFFSNKHITDKPWHKRYFKILTAVFSINLLARYFERKLYHIHRPVTSKYSKYAPATLFALTVYNQHRSCFQIITDPTICLPQLISKINSKVNHFTKQHPYIISTSDFIHGNTSIGIELEFSNTGRLAGNFFESGKDDPLLNFSKYHYYHLMKFMWRFGAYVDSNTPFKQVMRRGGFLEYTFTKPDMVFKPSEPLTSSPRLAAKLIEEAVKFTPIRPHSLHISLEISSHSLMKPNISFNSLIFLLMCTGHFTTVNETLIETRITEGNMKEMVVIRDRRNDDGWVLTIEFTHMRLCRDFVRREQYEFAILLLIAYKNLFSFSHIELYSKKLQNWANSPQVPDIDLTQTLEHIRKGLDIEISLPTTYKGEAVQKIRDSFLFNANRIIHSK